MNIYVGNLPYSVRDDELREAFEAYGDVHSAEVIFDRRTQRSRGYGFVEMQDDSEATDAISALNGSDFQGRELRVDESKPKQDEDSPRPRNNQSQRNSDHRGAAAPQPSAATSGGVVGFIKRIFG